MGNEFVIEELQMTEDQVNMFLGFPPKYSIPTVVKRLKGESAQAIF